MRQLDSKQLTIWSWQSDQIQECDVFQWFRSRCGETCCATWKIDGLQRPLAKRHLWLPGCTMAQSKIDSSKVYLFMKDFMLVITILENIAKWCLLPPFIQYAPEALLMTFFSLSTHFWLSEASSAKKNPCQGKRRRSQKEGPITNCDIPLYWLVHKNHCIHITGV